MMEMGIDDFALILSCEDDDKGEWTGNVDIHEYYSEENKYDKDTQEMVLNMMSLMNTCVTLMETDEKFLQKVCTERARIEKSKVSHELRKQDDLEKKVSKAPKIISTKGNVIKVDWKGV